jgi:hypothetical protein
MGMERVTGAQDVQSRVGLRETWQKEMLRHWQLRPQQLQQPLRGVQPRPMLIR